LFDQFATIDELLAVQSFINKEIKKSKTKKKQKKKGCKYKLTNKQIKIKQQQR
jgi:hypothetical protein